MHSKSLSPSHHVTLHSSCFDRKQKSECWCGPFMCFVCCLWLMIPALWKLRVSHLRREARAAPMDSCEVMDHCDRNHKCHRKGSLSLAVLRGLPAPTSRMPSSALQSIVICLFMPASLLFSLNRRKQPDSSTVFHPSSLLS